MTRLVCAAILSTLATAYVHGQVWTRQLGSSANDFANAIVSDGAGGAYVFGDTEGLLGALSAGGRDAWLARYDAAGNLAWIRQLGATSDDYGWAAASDGSGGVFVAGESFGAFGGPLQGRAWLARYNADGDRLWITQLTIGATTLTSAHALSPDGSGGSYMTGTSNNVGPTGERAFLARFDALGNQLWVHEFGLHQTFGFAACADGTGGAFVAGQTDSVGGPYTGSRDAFVARYDSAGTQIWVRQFGSTDADIARAVTLDNAGGVYIAGDTRGDLGGPNAGSDDGWLARYDSAGTQLWTRQFGSGAEDVVHALASDGAGGAYAGGYTNGSLGGPSLGSADSFLAQYDAAGVQLRIDQFGTINAEGIFALAPHGASGLLAAGITDGSLGGPNAGGFDAWIARTGCAPDLTTTAIPGSPGYGQPNGTLNNDDFFYYLVQFAAGNLAVADMTTTALVGSPGYGIPNGVLNNDDFFYYLSIFAAGC